MRNSDKTHCIHGHELSPDNLVLSNLAKKGKRNCLICHRANGRSTSKQQRTKRQEYKKLYRARCLERDSAGQALRTAVREGHIAKPDRCQDCGVTEKIEAHHEDYSKPLEVAWLCPRCHKAHDRKRRANEIRIADLPMRIVVDNKNKEFCPKGHAYDKFNTYYHQYRNALHRKCRTCNRERSRVRRAMTI